MIIEVENKRIGKGGFTGKEGIKECSEDGLMISEVGVENYIAIILYIGD
jgi:hypothetical protein